MFSSARSSNRRLFHASAALGLASILGTGLLLNHQANAEPEQTQSSPVAKDDLAQAISLSNAFKSVSKSVAPTVVHVTSTDKPEATTESGGNRLRPEFPDPADPFSSDELFRRFFDSQGGFSVPQPRERVGQGTGVIIRPDGYIVTNNHVVSGADEIKIKLSDDREYEATVVGTDVESDLAVIKIEADGLAAATLGDSSKLEQGEWVVAVGNPFGLDHTVTAGIVSAKGRMNMGLAAFEDFIQTDAAINPGNSGGPLVNLYGEVVGINTAITTRTGSSMGIGFAIPSNMVKQVVNSIIETGSVERGWLGVNIQQLNPDLAASFGFKGSHGVLVAEVVPDTPAERAGLESEDIITKVKGRQVGSPAELLKLIAEAAPGEKIDLELYRGGKAQSVAVTLGKRPLSGRDTLPETTPDYGLSVQTLTPEIAQQLNLRNVQGVVVTAVVPDSVAAKAGLQRGDVVGKVGDTPVHNSEDFAHAMQAADLKAGVRVLIHTSEATRYTVLKADND